MGEKARAAAVNGGLGKNGGCSEIVQKDSRRPRRPGDGEEGAARGSQGIVDWGRRKEMVLGLVVGTEMWATARHELVLWAFQLCWKNDVGLSGPLFQGLSRQNVHQTPVLFPVR
jgi:hypothetical protein